MNDRRFLALLNDVAAQHGAIWDAQAARRGEPAAIAAWAEFLSACVARGISIADPRWRELEVRLRGGRPCFALPTRAKDAPARENDFSVGLALLMGLLERNDEST